MLDVRGKKKGFSAVFFFQMNLKFHNVLLIEADLTTVVTYNKQVPCSC